MDKVDKLTYRKPWVKINEKSNPVKAIVALYMYSFKF